MLTCDDLRLLKAGKFKSWLFVIHSVSNCKDNHIAYNNAIYCRLLCQLHGKNVNWHYAQNYGNPILYSIRIQKRKCSTSISHIKWIDSKYAVRDASISVHDSGFKLIYIIFTENIECFCSSFLHSTSSSTAMLFQTSNSKTTSLKFWSLMLDVRPKYLRSKSL